MIDRERIKTALVRDYLDTKVENASFPWVAIVVLANMLEEIDADNLERKFEAYTIEHARSLVKAHHSEALRRLKTGPAPSQGT